MHGLQMCVRKISGSVEMWGLTCSSLLQSQIFYVYRPRPPAFRYVPIVRGSGVSEQGVPLFTGLSGTGIHRVLDFLGGRRAAGAGHVLQNGTIPPALGRGPGGAWRNHKARRYDQTGRPAQKPMRPQIEEAEGRRMSRSRWWGSSNCGCKAVSDI